MDEGNQILQMVKMNKSFPGVQALKEVDFELEKGEVRGLLGENGAGKSTLMKVLGGVYQPDSGDIYIEGKREDIRVPSDADDLGIMFVHQELSLFPDLDVASNVFTTKAPHKGPFVQLKKMYKETAEILRQVNLDGIDPKKPVNELTIGEQQLVEISRCLVMNTKVLVLDEPTSSLTSRETETLFQLIRTLQQRGVSIVFISHRMDEVFEICNSVTIMRDGRRIVSDSIQNLDRGDIVRHMIGRELGEMFHKKQIEAGDELLRVEHLSRRNKFEDVNFVVRQREIVGLYGLLGSGRSEIVRAIFGLDKHQSGEIYVKQNQSHIHHPEDAIKLGMGLVPEERHKEGLALEHSVVENLTMVNLPNYSKFGIFMDGQKEQETGKKNVEDFSIKTPSLKRLVKYLSGGNQQKVVIAKWINTHPELLILDEPTRGVDVGAKSEIYDILGEFVMEGMGVLIISSELNEVCELCDRVYVIKKGHIIEEYKADEIKRETILAAAMGV